MYYKLNQPGFLKYGLVIFGDCAYVNGGFMVSPYKGAKTGVDDDFNFFHSQIRITIERAFGMLVKRFGILRRAMAQHIPIKKKRFPSYLLAARFITILCQKTKCR